MEPKRMKRIWAFLLGALCTFPLFSYSQSGEETFTKSCAACHKIGGGKLVGPDLKDVTKRRKQEWIIKFVKDPQAMINSGDADAKAMFDEFKMPMPSQPLSDQQIKDVLSYIESKGGEAAPAPEPAATAPSETKSVADPKEQILLGKQYFEGSKAFSNGGPSCISCHHVNYPDLLKGGALAKDLSKAYSRLGGEAGIGAFMTSPPSAMKTAFENNPLSQEEISAISAFLKDADKVVTPEPALDPLFIGGSVAFCVLFVLIMIIWNKRKTQMVKQNIYDRQIKSYN